MCYLSSNCDVSFDHRTRHPNVTPHQQEARKDNAALAPLESVPHSCVGPPKPSTINLTPFCPYYRMIDFWNNCVRVLALARSKIIP